jgi:Flp pilus assembly protein TadD
LCTIALSYYGPYQFSGQESELAHRYSILAAFTVIVAGSLGAWGRDGHVIELPRHSQLTPVQRLNREGVEAVKKHDFRGAEALFYRAYLYDPSDPFTLNNLGYISEVDGNLDRAQKFYGLASEQGSNASIDISSAKSLQGKPMMDALVNLHDAQMRVNQENLEATRLLSEDHPLEALAVLKQNLPLEPRDPFTLNNLGVASEAAGDFDGAVRYYLAAASLHSSEPAAVTLDRSWQGRSVSEIAAASAERLERRMQMSGQSEERAIMLTIRGVMAANQNEWSAATEDFLAAYSADPTSAFTMNNRGWVAEREGDLETAEYYYGKAQRASNAEVPVGLATRAAAEGQSLDAVANKSNGKVDDALDLYSQQRKQQPANIELTPRESSQGSSAGAPPVTAQPTPQH